MVTSCLSLTSSLWHAIHIQPLFASSQSVNTFYILRPSYFLLSLTQCDHVSPRYGSMESQLVPIHSHLNPVCLTGSTLSNISSVTRDSFSFWHMTQILSWLHSSFPLLMLALLCFVGSRKITWVGEPITHNTSKQAPSEREREREREKGWWCPDESREKNQKTKSNYTP